MGVRGEGHTTRAEQLLIVKGNTRLGIQPLTRTVTAGQVFTMSVQIDTGTQPIDGAEFHLNFDPQVLHVVDAAGSPTSTIAAGETLSLELLNHANNATGTIDYAAGIAFESPPAAGRFTVATLFLGALRPPNEPDLRLSFVFTSTRLTDVTFEGQSVLGGYTDGQIIVLRQVFLPFVER
ncbi:MAG: hypothetical protein A2Z04_07185 [Chloroflexi bacterium RBG_16_57_9]|nr:MAG: hypothetical protein A2Z04_07185 [Chloroflexi bacterium RBG_16_57_9]